MKLDEYKNTLIASSSGSGKSVFVDAICYALYGKPYRSIRLPQLINSINQKGTVVVIEFNIGTTEFKVVRGMKPGIFEIYQDGSLLDQEAATRDYQGFLEKSILKINYKTFCHVVLIGTAGFTPFMQLPTGQRRDVIEDVLDIAIFSEMNVLLKHLIIECRDSLVSVNNKIESVKKDVQNQKRIIKLMEEHHQDKILSIEAQKISTTDKNKALLKDISDTQKNIEIIRGEIKEIPRNYSRDIFAIEDNIERIESSLTIVGKLDSCPTCKQDVSEDHKEKHQKENKQIIKNLKSDLGSLKIKHDEYQNVLDKNRFFELDIKKYQLKLNHFEDSIVANEALLSGYDSTIQTLKLDTSGLESEKLKLRECGALGLKLLKTKEELLEEKSIQEVVLGLLKDSGIKSAIIREYIPILNKLINKYLTAFEFNVGFTLDETFNERIISRGRDEFSYNSFSAGEKMRIDLSILFAFRQITELKNSTNVNLLFLDEMGDQSLDLNGKQNFVDILSKLENCNNFVISHNAPDTEIYDQVLYISKKNDFSVLEYR